MPDEACRKCGNEPRQGSHPWGKACRAEYRRSGKAGNVTAVTPPDGNPVTPLPGEVERLTAALEAEKASRALDVKVFEEQIAGLKAMVTMRENTIATLTARLAKLEATPRSPREEAEVFEATMARSRVENMPAPKKGLGGQYTPHGENCGCIAHRAERSAQRALETA